MYLTWEYYLRAIWVIAANLFLLLISTVVVVATGQTLWFLLELFTILSFLVATIYTSDEIPDEYHMHKKNKYRVIGTHGYIYVKMPLFWVRTNHEARDGDLTKFQELKAEYRHSGKGKTYKV